jgi:hypothetical protein
VKTYTITKKDLNDKNEYIGKQDLADFDGHVEADAGLGTVTVKGWLRAKGRIWFAAGSGIKAGEGITAGWGITAGSGIKAGSGIAAGWGITAGSGIKAGEGITAGSGITAGLAVACALVLSFNHNLFAGTAHWKKASADERTVTCGKLEKGTIVYGVLVETGLPDETPAVVDHTELRERLEKAEAEVKAVREALAV